MTGGAGQYDAQQSGLSGTGGSWDPRLSVLKLQWSRETGTVGHTGVKSQELVLGTTLQGTPDHGSHDWPAGPWSPGSGALQGV